MYLMGGGVDEGMKLGAGGGVVSEWGGGLWMGWCRLGFSIGEGALGNRCCRLLWRSGG